MSKPNRRSIKINGLTYHYIIKGTGKPIFFLHGFPDTANTWDSIIEVLSEGYCCIAPFLRGYHPTDISDDSDYAVYTIAKDIYGIAEQLNLGSFNIIGQDWGASIAYAMANMFPNEVDKVCTMAMPHPQFLKPSLTLLYKARHILYFMNKRNAVHNVKKNNYLYIEKLYKRWSPNWKNYSKNLEDVVANFKQSGRVEAALGYYWNITTTDDKIAELYKKLPSKPILVLVGECDGTVDLKHFAKMQAYPESLFKVIRHPSAGHFIHQEDAAFCLAQIQYFFKQE